MTWEDAATFGPPISGGTYEDYFWEPKRWLSSDRWDFDWLWAGAVTNQVGDTGHQYSSHPSVDASTGTGNYGHVVSDGRQNGMNPYEPWDEMWAAGAIGWMHDGGEVFLSETAMDAQGRYDDWLVWDDDPAGGEAYERWFAHTVIPPVSGELRAHITTHSGDAATFGTPNSWSIRKPYYPPPYTPPPHLERDILAMPSVQTGVTGTAITAIGDFVGPLPTPVTDPYWGEILPIGLAINSIYTSTDSQTRGDISPYGVCNRPTYRLIFAIDSCVHAYEGFEGIPGVPPNLDGTNTWTMSGGSPFGDYGGWFTDRNGSGVDPGEPDLPWQAHMEIRVPSGTARMYQTVSAFHDSGYPNGDILGMPFDVTGSDWHEVTSPFGTHLGPTTYYFVLGVGVVSGTVELRRLWVCQGEGGITLIPRRQRGRTDGLIGSPRQGGSAGLRQGRQAVL